MKRYAIYNMENGKILRMVLCHRSQVEVQHAEGEGMILIPDYVRDTTHKIVDGELVELPITVPTPRIQA